MNATETKTHTPGPWKIRDEYSDGEDVLGSDGYPVAQIEVTAILPNWSDTGAEHWSRKPGETYIERDEDEWRANAKLIAAAPELLEALQGLVGDHGVRATSDLIDAARAAIAKATT